MKTNAYRYREALRTIEEYKDTPHIDEAMKIYEDSGLTYLEDIKPLMSHIPYDGNLSLAYICSQMSHARKTIERYDKMFADGWRSIHDITLEDNGLKVEIKGMVSADFMNSQIDTKAYIVARENMPFGYRKPKQRTRYISHDMTADVFFRAI